MSKKVFLRIWNTSIHWHFNSPLESTNSCLSKAKRKYILYIFKAVFVMSKKSFFFLQKYMLGICKGRTRFTFHCAHIHIFQLALRKEFLQRKIGKCEFCNRARRNLVIYEIVSLREQNHHLKYTKQSPKTVLIEEYLLQDCNRRQNKFAPTHQDCERWAFIPKNASEQNILYSPALKIIFRDPGEIF